MISTYIRSSSLNKYKFCEQAFFIAYNLGIPEISNKKADMGTIVHGILEILAILKKSKQKGRKTAKTIVGRLTNDFEKLNIDRLINKVYNKYTEFFNHHSWTNADFKLISDWTYKVLTSSYDPRYKTIVEPERKFDLELLEPWAEYEYYLGEEHLTGNLRIKGTIDLIVEEDETTYQVIDWKTGKRLDWATGEEKTIEKLEKDPQLMLYYYVINRLYPDKQVTVTINYINDGGPFTIHFNKSTISKCLDMLKKHFEEVKKNKMPQLLDNGKNWKCTKLCHFGKNTFEGTDVKVLYDN